MPVNTTNPQIMMGFPAQQQGMGVMPQQQQQGLMGYPQQQTAYAVGNLPQQLNTMRFTNPASSSMFPASTATPGGGGSFANFGK